MAQENHSYTAPAGLGNTVYICSSDDLQDIKGSVNLDTGKWLANPMELSFELSDKDVNRRSLLKLNPKRLPRKEKKRRKVSGYITSVAFGLNDNKEYVYLFHNHALGAALPLLSAEHKAQWQRIAAWLNANPKRSLDLNKVFRF